MSHLGNHGFIRRLITTVEDTLHDRLEQCYRICRKIVRPFRYWDILSLLKFAEQSLLVNGMVLFMFSNRLLLRPSPASIRGGQQQHVGSYYGNSLRGALLFRRLPSNREEAKATLFWLLFLCFGFPFYLVRHPPQRPSSSLGWFRTWIHPTLYWSFFSLYKVVWTTRKMSRVAWWLTDPQRRRQPQRYLEYLPDLVSFCQRERVLQFSMRYQSHFAELQREIFENSENKSVRCLQMENKWVSFGNLGVAVADIVDEARERERLTPQQLTSFCGRMGRSLRNLEEVTLAMSLPLPLMAVGRLLQTAPKLTHLRLDGLALSVGDLQQDIVEFGRILHCVNSPNRLPLTSLCIEYCWLVDDELDPQERQRFSMDLLLSPAIFTAMTPPTRFRLKHLTLWVKCQMISALELAVMMRANTTLKSLSLELRHDGDETEAEEQDDDWFIVPLCQVLQYSNRTLKKLTLLLSCGIDPDGFGHGALAKMMKYNDALQTVDSVRTDHQLRIRIPEVEYYLYLNRLRRREFRLDFDRVPRNKWVELIISERRNVAVVYYFLSLHPSLLINYQMRPQQRALWGIKKH